MIATQGKSNNPYRILNPVCILVFAERIFAIVNSGCTIGVFLCSVKTINKNIDNGISNGKKYHVRFLMSFAIIIPVANKDISIGIKPIIQTHEVKYCHTAAKNGFAWVY